MPVLVVHNRYRLEGGEERSVQLQLDALRRAGIEHAVLERRSADASPPKAALALLTGGVDTDDVHAAVGELGADVAHVHNMLPLLGPKALQAARDAGAAVVLQLHNLRLFCAIGVAARDGGPCFRCHHRNTLPGLILNCRGSLPEAAVYATSLARHQPRVFENVDRFVVPSSYAAGQSALLGVPAERLEGVPLRVVGEGPADAELAELAARTGAPVDFIGRLERASLERELAGASMLLVPSRYHEFAGYSALEAMAAGVPVIASTLGALPEIVGSARCVPPNDPAALAARMTALWDDPDLRRIDGDRLIARARAHHSESGYVSRLLELYAPRV